MGRFRLARRGGGNCQFSVIRSAAVEGRGVPPIRDETEGRGTTDGLLVHSSELQLGSELNLSGGG